MMGRQGKKIFIDQITEGGQVADYFLVSAMNLAETKAGKPYLALTIMDRTGELQGRVWDNAQRFAQVARPGKVVHLRGIAQSFRDVLQLKIDLITAVEDEQSVDLADFVPSTVFDVEEMAVEFKQISRSVADPALQSVLRRIFTDKFFNQFKKAPAAKKMHHAYLGGLLEHTLSVTRLAVKIAGHYPAVDRDLLVAGALLHDIGKVREFHFSSVPFDYTDVGRLVGHLVLGSEMVRNAVVQEKKQTESRIDQLVHLILSHHGRYEYGSPCLPMTMEAMLLNFIDDMDAKVNYIEKLSEKLTEPGYQWSAYQRPLERFLFLRGQEEPEEMETETVVKEKPIQPEEGKKQQRLF